MHAPQSAQGTRTVDTSSTSSDSAMGDIRGNVSPTQCNQLRQKVRVQKSTDLATSTKHGEFDS